MAEANVLSRLYNRRLECGL